MLLLNHLTQSVLQLIIFSLLPLLTYIISRRRLKGFLSCIGLKPAKINNWRNVIVGFFLSYVILFLGLIIMRSSGTYTDKIDSSMEGVGVVVFILSLGVISGRLIKKIIRIKVLF